MLIYIQSHPLLLKLLISDRETILDLKTKIGKEIRVPIGEQSLTFACKPLRDQLHLSDYSIRDRSTIELNVRMRGGSAFTYNKVIPQDLLMTSSIVKQKRASKLLNFKSSELKKYIVAERKHRNRSTLGQALKEVLRPENILPNGYSDITEASADFERKIDDRHFNPHDRFWKIIRSFQFSHKIDKLVPSLDGKTILIVDERNMLHIYNAAQNRLEKTFESEHS